MLENHSYDNFLGTLGRGRGETPRGDGFTLAADGRPTAANPSPDGRPLRAFRMPPPASSTPSPGQEWEQSHIQYANGTNSGFVVSTSVPVAMGYWTWQDLPFTYDLAGQFPVGDRWFASALAQTDPQRRFLIAATANGMTDDIGGSIGNLVPDASLGAPANGTIFERLTAAGISWIDYAYSFPTGATMELYPTNDGAFSATNVKSFDQFYADAKAGTLPSFSLLDPNLETQAQENPRNIVLGDSRLARVVGTLGASPAWRRTLLIVTYDEHGGYYDHVPPPPPLAPDAVAPQVQPGESTYDGFARCGFRVPSIVVGPYAKRDFVSHTLYGAGENAATWGPVISTACSSSCGPPRHAARHRDRAPSLGRRREAHHRLPRVAYAERRVILKVDGRRPPAGHSVVLVRHGHRTLLRRVIRVR